MTRAGAALDRLLADALEQLKRPAPIALRRVSVTPTEDADVGGFERLANVIETNHASAEKRADKLADTLEAAYKKGDETMAMYEQHAANKLKEAEAAEAALRRISNLPPSSTESER